PRPVARSPSRSRAANAFPPPAPATSRVATLSSRAERGRSRGASRKEHLPAGLSTPCRQVLRKRPEGRDIRQPGAAPAIHGGESQGSRRNRRFYFSGSTRNTLPRASPGWTGEPGSPARRRDPGKGVDEMKRWLGFGLGVALLGSLPSMVS